MKKAITILALLLIIGSAGALEVGHIGEGRCVLQALIGFSALTIAYWKDIVNSLK